MEPIIITIDGPSASGKSTVARLVAGKLGFAYVDSGSFYRGVAWKANVSGVKPADAAGLAGLLNKMDVRLFLDNRGVCFTVDGVNPGEELRSEATVRNVSEFAAVPEVRAQVVRWLKQAIRFGNLVVEGRDIGSVVFPDAMAKFYLDASPEERARRRHAEQISRKQDSNLASVQKLIDKRDRIDSTRKTAPLKIPDGAVVIDTTGKSIDEVVSTVLAAIAGKKTATADRRR